MRIILQFALVWLLMSAGLSSAEANKRVALVIGNSDYVHAAPLLNPGNDADDMAMKLETLDFQVVKGTDLDFLEMRRTIRDFVKALNGAEIALFFYAGHGLQVGGKNYMAPIDARLENENDLDFETVPIEMVLAAMERSTKVNLVFLDACRNNPLARSLARSMGTRSSSVGRGLARIGSGVGSMISFATQPGNVALDGKGRNSPFTAALVQNLGQPGEGITKSMIRVRNAVLKATKGAQVPWDNSSLTGEVILVPNIAAKERFEGRKAQETEARNEQGEIAYWNTINDTADKVYFEAYLAKYPDGQFSDLARLKLSALEKKARKSKRNVEQTEQETQSSQAFDRTKLTRLDPNAAGSALPKPTEKLAPEAVERELGLEPEDYQRVQVSLNALGYDVGAADGAFGPNSRSGLRKYQVQNRIEESGHLTGETLAALFKSIENTPKKYDGDWYLEFHRYNYSGSDPGGINMRTLLGEAKVTLRDNELFVVTSRIHAAGKSYFNTFKGRISDNGNLSISMRIGALFGKKRAHNIRISAQLPKLVPYGRDITIRGSKLWQMRSNNENVWLSLEIRRLKPS